MTATASEAMRFVPFRPARSDVLRCPRCFDFLDRLISVPVADTEFLQVSQHLPLALRDHGSGCEVVAVVHSALVAAPLLRRDGRWAPAYLPIALRSLPLRRAGQSLEITSDIEAGADATLVPLSDEAGAPHRDFKALVHFLDRLEAGKARLERAAKRLVAADLVVELDLTAHSGASSSAPLLVVDRRRLQNLSGSRAAALADDDFLALDLATACCFSVRLFARDIVPVAVLDEDGPALRSPLDHLTQNAFAIDLRIDDSALFSSEAFHRALERGEAAGPAPA